MGRMVESYLETLFRLAREAEVTSGQGTPVPLDDAVRRFSDMARAAHNGGRKTMFIGNGGSAGIASHSATDYSKNGNIRSMAFNDGSMLTCLGNDFGYEHVFAKQIEYHGGADDVLVAISSSGKSPNILNAVRVAREVQCQVVTFSGFDSDNPLRSSGDLNFYVRSGEYGFVELSHQALIHAVLDISMGWRPRH